MERENRYLVVKRSDLELDLSYEQRAQLDDLLYRVTLGRAVRGKPARDYVVIANHYPMYEVVWQLLAAYVDNVLADEATLLERAAWKQSDNAFIRKLGVMIEAKTIKLAEQQKDIEKLRLALLQFLDPEGRPPEDTGEWRLALQILKETAPQ